MTSPKTLLFDDTATRELMERVAELIISDINSGILPNPAFIGIQSKGVLPARKVSAMIAEKCDIDIPVGLLDINMYRDDIGKRKALPHIHETEILFDLDDRAIILFDDVLHTGRTIRAALDAITDYGRPELIRLAVLIDRGGQEFPIKANYIGKTIDMENKDDFISLSFQEIDDKYAVHIVRR